MSKTFNEYAGGFGKLYEQTPKAVFAAVAYSLAAMYGEDVEALPNDTTEIARRFLREWTALHDNGIVPQKPPKRVEVKA